MKECAMSVADLIVVFLSAALLGALGWFFFGPRRSGAAELADGVQRAQVTVRGGYSPNVLRVRQGVPVELVFDRQESGDCTSRVVFADLRVSAVLPAYQRTTVRLAPREAGSFGFACGMNMIHGTLIVEPAARSAGNGDDGIRPAVPERDPVDAGPSERQAADAETAQAAERRTEIRDLSRRVALGAVLTAPVLFAVMADCSTPAGCPVGC
jgi:Cu+-exporting ATPase